MGYVTDSARIPRPVRTPRRNGLGVWGLDTLISWGSGKVVDAIRGESPSDKTTRALTPGAACPGGYTEELILQAIGDVGTGHPLVSELRRLVTIKDWLQGVGIERDDVLLARAAAFLANGGQDCKPGATETQVANGVQALLTRAGASMYPTPTYATGAPAWQDALRTTASRTVDALQERYLTPEQERQALATRSAAPRSDLSKLALPIGGLLLLKALL